MSTFASLSAVLLATASPSAATEVLQPEVAAKRVSDCGFGVVRARDDDELQETILVAAPAGPVSDEQIACADAAAGFYTLELPPSLQIRFNATREKRYKALFDTQNREWLKRRGLLGKIPAFDSKTDDAQKFARLIERVCGAEAKGALQSKFGPHAVDPKWMLAQSVETRSVTLECLVRVAGSANFELGIIGNEAFTP